MCSSFSPIRRVKGNILIYHSDTSKETTHIFNALSPLDTIPPSKRGWLGATIRILGEGMGSDLKGVPLASSGTLEHREESQLKWTENESSGSKNHGFTMVMKTRTIHASPLDEVTKPAQCSEDWQSKGEGRTPVLSSETQDTVCNLITEEEKFLNDKESRCHHFATGKEWRDPGNSHVQALASQKETTGHYAPLDEGARHQQ